MHIMFPSNFVYWAKVKDHHKIKEKFYTKILEKESEIVNNNSWLAKVKTSYDNDELNKIFYTEEFSSSVIWPYFDKMLEELSEKIPLPVKSYLTYCWYNLYDKGNFQEPHQHDRNYNFYQDQYHSNSFCGIYLIHLEEKNKTIFYQEPPIPCNVTNSGFEFNTDFLEEGSVIFFPSGLTHYVMPSESRRCSISFNLTSIYDNANMTIPIRYE